MLYSVIIRYHVVPKTWPVHCIFKIFQLDRLFKLTHAFCPLFVHCKGISILKGHDYILRVKY